MAASLARVFECLPYAGTTPVADAKPMLAVRRLRDKMGSRCRG